MFTKNVTLEYSFAFGGETIRPGRYLKLKGVHDLVRFECIVHNCDDNKDYLRVQLGKEDRLFPMNRLARVVSLKRSRKACTI